jgi:acyl carrier protein
MEKFIESIADILEVEESVIIFDADFRDCENWDSLAQLSFLALAEDDYNISLSNDQLQDAVTFGDLFNLVKQS